MKKYFLIILNLFILLVIAPGCNKDLQENPKTFISPDAFFQNPDSYELAVKGAYSGVDGFFQPNSMSMRELFTDICGAPNAAVELALSTYLNGSQPFYYCVRDQWSIAYSIIKNANYILSKLPDAPLADDKKNSLMAEVRFLRAYAYFQIVQFFGDVPLRKEPVVDFTQVTFPRTSQADVYKFILDDLTFAESNLSDVAPQKGRVYKLAATALLARVYLTMAGNPLNMVQYYTNARDKALLVIKSGKFTLMDDYSKVFHNTTYTSESIWEQTFEIGLGGNQVHNISCTAVGYIPMLVPATWFINSFPAGDQRKAWGVKDNYVGPNGIVLAPFFQKFVNNTLIDNGTGPSSAIVNYTYPYLRLAEMYLIAAEAENMLNGPTSAYQYINKIRTRARINKTDPTNVPDLIGLTKDQFTDAVLMERKWELHMEGSTWFDLKRTNTMSRIQTIRGANLLNPITAAHNNTWFIPDTEVVNNNIPQNPGY